jgi:TldD protein
MKEGMELALDVAAGRGASYCDVRVQRCRQECLAAREQRLESVTSEEEFGVGVRVLLDGTWGFAAGPRVTPQEIRRLTLEALGVARAKRPLQREPVELAPVPAYRDTWQTPALQDPMRVSLARKADLLLELNRAALEAGADFVHSALHAVAEDKLFASSAGSFIEQRLVRVWPTFQVTAVDRVGGEFKTRDSMAPPLSAGYEAVEAAGLVEEAARAAEEARMMLTAVAVEPGRRDLILHPTNLWLVLHESTAHATELDRVLGYEANYAGTSFATPEKLGRFRYGAPLVHIFADRTQPRGLATVGYDDEGVRAGRWPLVQDGVLVDYQTTREQVLWPEYRAARAVASLPPRTESHGCSSADSYRSVQFQRIPNVSLAPGPVRMSLEDLIADTDEAILIYGDGSWSIDHQRYNFQFGGQTFWEVRRGKVRRMLRDVAYQASTQEFWNACDAIGSEEHFFLGGSFYCGKGEPLQLNGVSHGCAPARFRSITVLNTGRRT